MIHEKVASVVNDKQALFEQMWELLAAYVKVSMFSSSWQIQDDAVFWDFLFFDLSAALFLELFFLFLTWFIIYLCYHYLWAYRVSSNMLIDVNFNAWYTTVLWSLWILLLTGRSWGPGLEWFVPASHTLVPFALLFSMCPVMFYHSFCIVSGLLWLCL